MATAQLYCKACRKATKWEEYECTECGRSVTRSADDERFPHPVEQTHECVSAWIHYLEKYNLKDGGIEIHLPDNLGRFHSWGHIPRDLSANGNIFPGQVMIQKGVGSNRIAWTMMQEGQWVWCLGNITGSEIRKPRISVGDKRNVLFVRQIAVAAYDEPKRK